MRKLRFVLLIVLALFFIVSCAGQGVSDCAGGLCVATWNVQNLFDANLDGNEYEEYRPSSGWTQSAYESRLSNARKVLQSLPQSESYIIVLNEIEGPNVVEDLIKNGDIAKMGLRYYACAGMEGGAIQTAVISSLPIAAAKVHDVGEGQRPILEAEFDTSSGKIFVLALHLKSNIGTSSETAAKRREAALTVKDVSDQILSDNPGSVVLVCGDMNEECWDNNVFGKGDDAVLKAKGEFGRDFWYCLWMDTDLNLWPGGSYMYNGLWKCYDNILLSASAKDQTGWEYESCGLVFENIQKTADSKPFAWDRDLLRGVSDHLPLWVRLNSF
ncbi:MAG: endonuclease/exonuclease/phosphatase family protein [Spirochaetales bacterium]|nr:endonuclease/exonuclease/phosphatase family protein [Spirochaetales bacterium]MBO7348537.1 endonuclease/exonuclease/phosphatase family protein [Spirochaetales bacterium]MBP5756083.1 endonuclease/exonuclease/phosphatase family protein [Spirochaetales bacterium]